MRVQGKERGMGKGGQEAPTGIWWVDPKDAVTYPIMQGIGHSKKELSNPSVNSADTENWIKASVWNLHITGLLFQKQILTCFYLNFSWVKR